MKDDLYNELFSDGHDPDPTAWVILAVGICVLLFCVWFFSL